MAFPSTVTLPISAKYFGLVDPKFSYNTNWDITWSFTYALTGTQHGICTFLSTTPILSNGLPGQYLGYSGYDTYNSNGVLAIALDSTGYFALSDAYNNGVNISQVNANSLIVRSGNNVIFNEPLSSLDTSFSLASSIKNYQTLRFRLANSATKLYVDYKNSDNIFNNLATIAISTFDISTAPLVYPAVTYCSPISSLSITPSTIWLKNFHTQGNTGDPTYEITEFVPLTSTLVNSFTTISGITAIQMGTYPIPTILPPPTIELKNPIIPINPPYIPPVIPPYVIPPIIPTPSSTTPSSTTPSSTTPSSTTPSSTTPTSTTPTSTPIAPTSTDPFSIIPEFRIKSKSTSSFNVYLNGLFLCSVPANVTDIIISDSDNQVYLNSNNIVNINPTPTSMSSPTMIWANISSKLLSGGMFVDRSYYNKPPLVYGSNDWTIDSKNITLMELELIDKTTSKRITIIGYTPSSDVSMYIAWPPFNNATSVSSNIPTTTPTTAAPSVFLPSTIPVTTTPAITAITTPAIPNITTPVVTVPIQVGPSSPTHNTSSDYIPELRILINDTIPTSNIPPYNIYINNQFLCSVSAGIRSVIIKDSDNSTYLNSYVILEDNVSSIFNRRNPTIIWANISSKLNVTGQIGYDTDIYKKTTSHIFGFNSWTWDNKVVSCTELSFINKSNATRNRQLLKFYYSNTPNATWVISEVCDGGEFWTTFKMPPWENYTAFTSAIGVPLPSETKSNTGTTTTGNIGVVGGGRTNYQGPDNYRIPEFQIQTTNEINGVECRLNGSLLCVIPPGSQNIIIRDSYNKSWVSSHTTTNSYPKASVLSNPTIVWANISQALKNTVEYSTYDNARYYNIFTTSSSISKNIEVIKISKDTYKRQLVVPTTIGVGTVPNAIGTNITGYGVGQVTGYAVAFFWPTGSIDGSAPNYVPL